MTPPILQVRQLNDDDWFVAATWPDGRSEEIKGSRSEVAASEWVAQEFHAWLDGRSKAEKPNA